MGLGTPGLLQAVREQATSVLEQGVPWWAPMITAQESINIERVLKTCLHKCVYSKQTVCTDDNKEQYNLSECN